MIEIELPGASVRFSTRTGGVSDGPYDSLNLGSATGDDPERVRENRRLVAAQAGVEVGSIAAARQVHGSRVIKWEASPPPGAFADPRGDPPEVDGHVTAEQGVVLLAFGADCLPVALATPSRVAMIHCGWRGLAEGIVGEAVRAFSGDASPAAVVGPGIGPCCFEVGPEVATRFADVDGAVAGARLDLRRVAQARLAEAGVERIEHVERCTCCEPEAFFSHRRDGGVTGRQCGMVWRS